MNINKVILNLGAGTTKMPGAFGVDSRLVSKDVTDVVVDLERFPYPFRENYIDEVHMYFVLEHLNDPFLVLCELWRILKDKGKVYIRVPHFSSAYCWGELTHKRAFAYGSFDLFVHSHDRSYYSKECYNILEKRIKYFLTYPDPPWYKLPNWQPHWAKYPIIGWIIKGGVRIIQSLIDLSPLIFERFWCYWVGGAAEVYAVLEAKKK